MFVVAYYRFFFGNSQGIFTGVLGGKQLCCVPLGERVADKTAANEVSEDLGAQGETSPS